MGGKKNYDMTLELWMKYGIISRRILLIPLNWSCSGFKPELITSIKKILNDEPKANLAQIVNPFKNIAN